MLRGVTWQVELYKIFLRGQLFVWKRKNLKTGKEEYTQVQGALRECIFGYEYIFPEECLDEVMTMFDVKNNKNQLSKTQTFIIRKMLGHGFNKIPEYNEVPNEIINHKGTLIAVKRSIPTTAVAMYPIGIKKDLKGENEIWGYEQEML